MRDAEEVEKAVTSQIKEKGFNDRLDIFVANSGVPWTQGAMVSGDIQNYRNVMAVDVDGVFYCARTAGRIWREQKRAKLAGFRGGSFVATASMSGHIANVSLLHDGVDDFADKSSFHNCKRRTMRPRPP